MQEEKWINICVLLFSPSSRRNVVNRDISLVCSLSSSKKPRALALYNIIIVAAELWNDEDKILKTKYIAGCYPAVASKEVAAADVLRTAAYPLQTNLHLSLKMLWHKSRMIWYYLTNKDATRWIDMTCDS